MQFVNAGCGSKVGSVYVLMLLVKSLHDDSIFPDESMRLVKMNDNQKHKRDKCVDLEECRSNLNCYCFLIYFRPLEKFKK